MSTWTIVAIVLVLLVVLASMRIPDWNPGIASAAVVRNRIAVVVAATDAKCAAQHVSSIVEAAKTPDRLVIIIAHAPQANDTDCLLETRRALGEVTNYVLAASIEIRVSIFPQKTSTSSMLLQVAEWVQHTETLVAFTIARRPVVMTRYWDALVATDLAMCMSKRAIGNPGVALQIAPAPTPSFAIIHRNNRTLNWQPFYNPPYNPLPTIAVSPAGMLVVHGDDWRRPPWAKSESSRVAESNHPCAFWSTVCTSIGLRLYTSGTACASCENSENSAYTRTTEETWYPSSQAALNAKKKWEHAYATSGLAHYGLLHEATSAERRFKWGSSDQQGAVQI